MSLMYLCVVYQSTHDVPESETSLEPEEFMFRSLLRRNASSVTTNYLSKRDLEYLDELGKYAHLDNPRLLGLTGVC